VCGSSWGWQRHLHSAEDGQWYGDGWGHCSWLDEPHGWGARIGCTLSLTGHSLVWGQLEGGQSGGQAGEKEDDDLHLEIFRDKMNGAPGDGGCSVIRPVLYVGTRDT